MTPIPESFSRGQEIAQLPSPLEPPSFEFHYFRIKHYNLLELNRLVQIRDQIGREEKRYRHVTDFGTDYGPFPSIVLPAGRNFLKNLVRFSLEELKEDRSVFREFGLDISWDEEREAVDVVLSSTGKAISIFLGKKDTTERELTVSSGVGGQLKIVSERKRCFSERARGILGALLALPEDLLASEFDGIGLGRFGSIWEMVLSGKTIRRLGLPLPVDLPFPIKDEEFNEEAYYFVREETAKEALKRGARPIVVEEEYY